MLLSKRKVTGPLRSNTDAGPGSARASATYPDCDDPRMPCQHQILLNHHGSYRLTA